MVAFSLSLEHHGPLGLVLVSRPRYDEATCPGCRRPLRQHRLAFAGETLCLVGDTKARWGCLAFREFPSTNHRLRRSA